MKKIPAFSLIEVSICLFIIGVLLTSVMKGLKLIDTAKTHSLVQQIFDIQQDYENFMDISGITTSFELQKQIKPKIGGQFAIENSDGKVVLRISGFGNTGVLTKDQSIIVKKAFPNTIIESAEQSGNSKKDLNIKIPFE